MIHQPVTSSHIKSIGYDPETKTMEVAFVNGSSYAYDGVKPALHQALLAAPSVGKHFRANVHGKFKHAVLQPAAPRGGRR